MADSIIEAVSQIKPEPGATILVKLARRSPGEAVQRIAELLRDLFPNNRAAIIDSRSELTVHDARLTLVSPEIVAEYAEWKEIPPGTAMRIAEVPDGLVEIGFRRPFAER